MLRDEVKRIWPELEWIEDENLRSKTTDCWERAFEYSPLTPSDLERIPFTLKVPDCPVSFMAHKRAVVHVARDAARTVESFFNEALPVDMDVLIAGAILADVGKLLEYEDDGEGGSRQSPRGNRSRWSAVCPTRSATSSPPTRARATWWPAPPRRGSSTTPTS